MDRSAENEKYKEIGMAHTLKEILTLLNTNQPAEALVAFDNYTYAYPEQAVDGL